MITPFLMVPFLWPTEIADKTMGWDTWDLERYTHVENSFLTARLVIFTFRA